MADSFHEQSGTHSGAASSTSLLKDEGSPPHDSAITHVTGKSEFVDDRPMLKGELHCGLVYSPFAHARLKRLDVAPALAIPGVVCAVTAADVSHNMWGGIFADQPIIAADETHFVGEVVAVIGAETKEALAQGLAAVVVQWEKLSDIRSIDEAVAQESFIGHLRTISTGDAQTALASSPRKMKGVLKIEGADHFYLESQAAVVYPREDGQLEVHSSTQHPTETQHVVAKACGIAFSDVVCVAKRLGGGFGGKETQASPFAAYAALVAKRTGRAARIVLTKDEDMIMTGSATRFKFTMNVALMTAEKFSRLTPCCIPTAAPTRIYPRPSWSARCCTATTHILFPSPDCVAKCAALTFIRTPRSVDLAVPKAWRSLK